MGTWLRREDEIFNALPPDRQANIEIVLSAYRSVFAKKAYLTHAVTTGKRFYDTLDHYEVTSAEELEHKRPGALYEEVILPNIEEARQLAKRIGSGAHALIVPGVFEARKQRWTQDEYMVLWMRFITLGPVEELLLSPYWYYTNGGVMEFCRGMMIRFGLIQERQDLLPVLDHECNPVTLAEGAWMAADAIKQLTGRGHDTAKLRTELTQIAGIGAYLEDPLTDRHTPTRLAERDLYGAVRAAQSVGAPVAFHPAH